MGKLKVWVDKELCISCGACIAISPEVFEWDSDGKSHSKFEIIEDENLKKKAIEARDNCPVNAIKTEEIN